MEKRKFFYGKPRLTGMNKYLILVRAEDDPQRKPRGSYDSKSWLELKKGDAEAWCKRIIKHLSDLKPRTFNRIVLEMSGGEWTADVCHEGAPEQGLWLAVEREYVVLTHDTPILFLHSGPHGARRRKERAKAAKK